MTVRRINHTGRIRILKGDVHVVVRAGAEPTFTASVDLSRYSLPGDALVFTEASRQTSWQRFPMGTVATVAQTLTASLATFGTAAGVRFALRVVARQQDATRPAMVLAACDRIRPKAEGGDAQAESLLPVKYGSFSDRPWKLEIDDDQPILCISQALVADASALVQSKAFRSLVLPEVFRGVLYRLVVEEKCVEIDDDEPEKSEWLAFAAEHLGVGLPSAEDDLVEWVDGAVTAWCQRSGVAEEFSSWWEEGTLQ